MPKKIGGLWRNIATHLSYLKSNELGGGHLDALHREMSQQKRDRYHEHWLTEIGAFISRIRKANLTMRQLRARLIRTGFTLEQIQETIETLKEYGYEPPDYTRK